MNENIMISAQWHFYIGSNSIATQMIELDKKYLKMKEDPALAHLFCWAYTFPLKSFLMIGTLVTNNFTICHLHG
jgi:hypothetical protein